MGLQEAMIEAQNAEHPHVSRRSDPHAYASEAGACARKVALRIYHSNDPRPAPNEDAIRLTGVLSGVIGNAVHELVQAAILKAYRNGRVEVPFDLDSTSGRADALYETQDGKLVVVEIKTKSPEQFKSAKTSNKPDFDNVLQAVLGALALHADYVHVIYVNKASRYFDSPLLEWIFPLDDELEEQGLLEVQRLERIVDVLAEGAVPAPVYHGQLIQDPTKEFWPCAFCPFKDACVIMGPEPYSLPEEAA